MHASVICGAHNKSSTHRTKYGLVAYLVGSLWVVGILVRVQFQGHLPVRLLDLIGSSRLGQTQQLVERIARRAACTWFGMYRCE